MGRVDSTESKVTPRRCSSRVRKPTYKLRKTDDDDASSLDHQQKLSLQKSSVETPLSNENAAAVKVAVVNSEKTEEIKSDEAETTVMHATMQVKDSCKTATGNRKGAKRKFSGKAKLDKSMENNLEVSDKKLTKIEERDSIDASKEVDTIINKGESIENDYIQDTSVKDDSSYLENDADNDNEKHEIKLAENGTSSIENVELNSLIKTEFENNLNSDNITDNTVINSCSKSEDNLEDSGFVFDDFIQNGMKTDGSATEVQEIKDEPDTVINCSVCCKTFYNRHGLNKHMFLHTDKKPFQCEICGVSFALKYYLTTHKLVHTGVRSHKCDICNKQFLRRTNLNSHKKTHIELKKYHCSICDKYFKTKPGKDNHDSCFHGNGGFICHTCGKSFSYQTYLQKHLSVHAGEKPFKCMECGKSFSYNQSLQEHLRRHQGEKPEICHLCAKRFNNKRELKQHLKYHENTEGYPCSECNVRYDTLQSLNKHMSKTHGKMHSCQHCNESFVNKKHLRTHMYKHHRDVTSQRKSKIDLAKGKKVDCNYCGKVFFNRYVLCKHLISKHQVSETEVKGMLNIRKKAVNKRMGGVNECVNDVTERVRDANGCVIDNDADFPFSLENDKSFQVYYKDDEMAVYVKRVDDLNDNKDIANLGHVTEEPERGCNSKLGQHFIVIEGETDRNNELIETDTNIASESLTDGLPTSIKSGLPVLSESHLVHNGILATEGNTHNENSYVVITEGHSDVDGLDNQVVGEAKMFEIDDNGSERIVLILNEASGENEIILDGSEQFEIIENSAEIAALSQTKELNENELNNIHNAGNNFEIVTNSASMMSGEYSLNEMHDEKSKMKIINGDKAINDYHEAIVTGSTELQNYLPTHLQSNVNNSLIITEYSDEENNKTSLQTENVDSQSNASFHGEESSNLTDKSCMDCVPKNNSDEEFVKFEEALKTKSDDFQSNSDYLAYLDKMIKSLQKAKHSSSQ